MEDIVSRSELGLISTQIQAANKINVIVDESVHGRLVHDNLYIEHEIFNFLKREGKNTDLVVAHEDSWMTRKISH